MSPSRLPIPNSESSQDSSIPKGTAFSSAALAAGTIAAARQRAGQTVEIRDVQIPGIATARRAILATRNTRHFETTGIGLVNPWD